MPQVMRYPTDVATSQQSMGYITSSDLKDRAEREDSLSGLIIKPCVYIEQTHTGTSTEKFFVHLVCLCGVCFGLSSFFCLQPTHLEYILRGGSGFAALALWASYIYKNSCF